MEYGVQFNNAVVVDPAFAWADNGWRTPDMSELIVYEMSVYGFTEDDPDIDPANRGKFKGVTERIADGYFGWPGVTALSIMPLAEFPSLQGPNTIGYDPSLYFTVERDFGAPGDLRELVNTAHQHGLAVLIDQVFNHTSNDFNPLHDKIKAMLREGVFQDTNTYHLAEEHSRWGYRRIQSVLILEGISKAWGHFHGRQPVWGTDGRLPCLKLKRQDNR